MKSLVEEASSITKAIEKAWIRAGQPQSFSVKIFETPEVGFLGFVKKSAKVGIFFEEPTPERTKKHYTRPTNKGTTRKPSEYKPRSNSPHREPREDSQEREPRRPAPRRREDNRETRPTNQHHREGNRETKPTNEHPSGQSRRPQQTRPTRETISRPEQTRAPHPSRPERPGQDRKPESNPAPKVIIPVSKPQEAVAPKVTKRPPKISGRRFSGHKKDKPEGDKS